MLPTQVEVENAAQHAWVAHGGAGRAAALLVDALRAEHGEACFDARLDCAVVAVTAQADAAAGGDSADRAGDGAGLLHVRTAAGEVFSAPHVVMAAPPLSVLQRIAITPTPPAEWRRCAERCFMGCYTKAVVLYDAPFWRERGLSGTCMRLAEWETAAQSHRPTRPTACFASADRSSNPCCDPRRAQRAQGPTRTPLRDMGPYCLGESRA